MSNKPEMIIYQSADGKTKIDINLEDETLWLSQAQMAELFEKSKKTISEHIQNIFEEGELTQEVVVRKYRITSKHGAIAGKTQTNEVQFYSLDMVIAVGYRVKSARGMQFRQWATAVLHVYLQKGYALNDDVLKNMGGGLYWKELLERIRDIRSSEKVLYRQILDLYATSLDYNPTKKETIDFFKIVQNKLHYAVTGNTASEIVFNRANANLPFMGLTTFKGNRPAKAETTIAKNYMDEKELFALRRMVSAFFDMAELKASMHEAMYMKDWLQTLDSFCTSFSLEVLEGAGKVTHLQATQKAHSEYETYSHLLSDEINDVEKAYLESLKAMQKRLEGKDDEYE